MLFRSITGDRIPFAATAHAMLGTISQYASRDGHAQSRQERQIIQVESVSLNDLLESHGAPADIDFISIDTEGSELDILSHFDFQRWNVMLFAVEHNLTEAGLELDKLMRRNGYERRFPGYPVIDAWYRRSN